jgi:LPS O-antigen subunit length determinant protein (WzzB/FepE family)
MKLFNLIIILVVLCVTAGLLSGFIVGSLYQQDRIIELLDQTAHEDVNILKGTNKMYEITEVTGTCHNTGEDSYSCLITNMRTGQTQTYWIPK